MRVVLAIMVALVAVPARAQELSKWVQQAEALGARTGIAVKDLGAKGLRAQIGADQAFAPASNMKLLTAAAVLRGLGPDYQFTTRFCLRGGKLVVVAGGDPNWITGTDEAPARVFARLVAAMTKAGVASIAGVAIDDGRFTGPERPPTWPPDQLDTYYCAPTGGVVMEQGTFALHVAVDGGGVSPSIEAPPVVLPFHGGIAVSPQKKGAVFGAVDLGDAVKLSGSIWRGSSSVTVHTAVRDPRTWALHALQQYLTAAGIRIDPAAQPPDQEVYVHRSPLRPALLRMLQDSSNFDAEQCLRVLGAEKRGDGSLEGGNAAVRTELEGLLGSVPDGVVIQDGSGLSRGNRVTPRLLVAALEHVLASPGRDVFLQCLPTGGESGTLEKRFTKSPVNGRVHAKTGWIRGVSALSGVVQRRDGSLRLFSILMGYERDKGGLNQELKVLQERMVEAIDDADRRP